MKTSPFGVHTCQPSLRPFLLRTELNEPEHSTFPFENGSPVPLVDKLHAQGSVSGTVTLTYALSREVVREMQVVFEGT